MSKPRGYTSTQMPRDPAKLLRALRVRLDATIAASREVNIRSPLAVASNPLVDALHGVAAVLTGETGYFWPRGGRGDDATRAHAEKWKRIEAGEEPWPK